MTTSTTRRVSRLTVPDESGLSARTRGLFRATRDEVGHLPNWLPAFAVVEEHFSRLNDFLFPLAEGSPDSPGKLTRREREILAAVVSVANGCSYCHTYHVDALAHVLGDAWLANRIAIDHREVGELTQRERLLADLAVTLTRTPGEIGDDRIAQLRAAGLSDADIFEAVQIIGVFNATNRITLALGVLPDPEIFASPETADTAGSAGTAGTAGTTEESHVRQTA